MRSIALFAPAICMAATAAFAQTGPVPYNDSPGMYGAPDRVGANQITIADAGRQVNGCGRVGRIKTDWHALLVGNNFVVYMPQDVAIDGYWGTVVCASGIVQVQNSDGFRFPAVTVTAPSQLVQIGGTGHYDPPRPQCGPGQMVENGQCVRRWRASPY